MGGRTTYRKLSPKRIPFQNGTDRQSYLQKVLERNETAAHILCEGEAIAYLRFCHLGHYFVELGDYHDALKAESCTSFEV
jgi:hypothetical protein